VVGCWHGYLSGARCRFARSPADITATHCLLLQEIHIGFGFIFLVPAHAGSPGKNSDSRKMVVVEVVLVQHEPTINQHNDIHEDGIISNVKLDSNTECQTF